MARTRTFLAINLGDAIRDRAKAVQAELAALGANVKWVEPRNFHLTLQFLGDLDDRDLAQLGRVVGKALGKIEPFRLALGGLGAFPNLRRPKVLWAGVTEGADDVMQLFQTLEAALLDAQLYRSEDRAYTPHLTLGRTAGEEDGAILAPALANYRGWTAGMTMVDEVLLMASDFKRGGPDYSVLGRVTLK